MEFLRDTVLQIFTSCISKSTRPLRALELFSDADQSQVMKWNNTLPARIEKCVHSLVEEQVKLYHDQPAVYSTKQQFTYLELDRYSTKLARHLAASGIGPETLVPFCHEKSAWTIVIMLAILKAGGACVALDPSYPVKRLSEIITATGARIVISQAKYIYMFEGLVGHVVTIGSSTWEQLDTLPSIDVLEAKSRDPAFVTFTSGSTGVPKGIILEHASMCTSFVHHGSVELVSNRCRSLQFGAYTFDVSVEEIFTTLTSGGCVCVPSEYERLNNLGGFIRSAKVNWAHLTPTVAGLLDPKDVTLDTLVLGGEAIRPHIIQRWMNQTQLIATYGPAECSITCSGVKVEHAVDGLMGLPAGALLWIVDPEDHNRLMPVGCPGEILIEGPLLARGYLSSEQTASAFIIDPTWISSMPLTHHSGPRRFYKSGDLARYNLDGSITSFGRKDVQIKIHGQRVDLREIEHHISLSSDTRHSAVFIPRNGYWKEKLVAVVSLQNYQGKDPKNLAIIQNEFAISSIRTIRGKLSSSVPLYMVPRAWIAVECMPVTLNGKLDRREVQHWLETMSGVVCEGILAQESDGKITEPSTRQQQQLCRVWSKVLNIPQQVVDIEQDFFSLGGDSISAMQITSLLRLDGMHLAVHDILRHRNISKIALQLKQTQETKPAIIFAEAADEQSFGLTAIQEMHFENLPVGQNHYNQSFLLRLRRRYNSIVINEALDLLVSRHPMLRARYCPEKSGSWTQRTVPTSKTSWTFSKIVAPCPERLLEALNVSQTNLDIRQGPVFSATLVNPTRDEDKQLLYLVAHHLVIDLVSWRIILEELEDILHNRKPQPVSLAFSHWATLQRDYAAECLSPEKVLPQAIKVEPNMNYWTYSQNSNTYDNVKTLNFVLTQKTTSSLLRQSQKLHETETVDLLVAAILYSFSTTFVDRSLPAIFSEGHGREPWRSDIDVSRTVGWFTTIFPISISMAGKRQNGRKGSVFDSFLDYLRRVKDARQNLSGKGWPYFTSRYLNAESRHAFSHHKEMEILFNFLGSYQQLEHSDALFERVETKEVSNTNGLVPRSSIFDISTVMQHGQLLYSIAFPADLAQYQDVVRWTNQLRTLLELVSDGEALISLPATSDYPLLQLSDYGQLDKLVARCISSLRLDNLNDIENIYPCAPLQHGILVSQARQSGLYDAWAVWQIIHDRPIDVERLHKACEIVVSRHQALRTILVETGLDEAPYVQVAFKHITAPINRVTLKQHDLNSMETIPIGLGVLPYRIIICQEPDTGLVSLRLDINHAISDGSSFQVFINNITRAYHDVSFTSTPVAQFSSFIEYLQKQTIKDSVQFWIHHLKDIKPCHFPHLNDGQPKASAPRIQGLEFMLGESQSNQVHDFCRGNNTTVADFMSTVWALVLRSYMGTDTANVCFGYISSGRDIPIVGASEMFGPLITMLIRKAEFQDDMAALTLMQRMSEDLAYSLPHQHTSLAKIHHALHLNGNALFNTVVNIQKQPAVSTATDRLLFKADKSYDPSEYGITFNISDSETEIAGNLQYWNTVLSEVQASNLRATILAAVQSLLQKPSQGFADVELVSHNHLQQLIKWNNVMPSTIQQRVHDLVRHQALDRPQSIALRSTRTSVTFESLERKALQLGHHLVSLGVGPECMIPYCFDKSTMAIIAMYSILKAGGACVALDSKYPIDRLKNIVSMCRTSLIICEKKHVELMRSVAGSAVKIVILTEDALHQLPYNELQLDRGLPSSPAFITFTSGSTGKPKGIILEHASVCISIQNHGRVELLGPNTRALQFAAFAFDVSIEEVFTTLAHGGCVCIPSEEERLNNLPLFIRSMDVNWAHLTPTVANLLKPEEVLPSLEVLILGGEFIPENLVAKWVSKLRLFATYGPAECSITCSGIEIAPHKATGGLMGYQVGALLWIVDPQDHNKLMPLGCPGEILIEGPLLARCYLDDEKQTASSFVFDPDWTKHFPISGVEQTSRRFYKSGDLARFNVDGSLTSIRRKDNTVKIHGQRVDLTEIDQHILNIGGKSLRHGTTLFVTLGPFKDQLVVVFSVEGLQSTIPCQELELVPNAEQSQITQKVIELRTGLERRVPGYMMPKQWIAVVSMPFTSNGKLDRQKISMWLESVSEQLYKSIRSTEVQTITEPTNAIERQIQKVWSSVLNIPRDEIGIHQTFFSFGGDSISAMQVTSKLRLEDSLRVSVQDILQLRTIANIATSAENLYSVAQEIDIEDSTDSFHLSPIQTMHFQLMSRGTNHYNQSFLLKLKRNITETSMREALTELVICHSMLRARFQHEDGHWTQRIAKDGGFRFEAKLVSTLAEAYDAFANSQQKLNIHDGPVFSADFIGVEDGSQYLFLTAHHLVIDLVSWRIVFEDLKTLLQTRSIPRMASLSFQSWVRLQSDYAEQSLHPDAVLTSEVPTADYDYWGITKQLNTGDQVVTSTFKLASHVTANLLGSCNNMLRTEPVEIFIASVMFSFADIFGRNPVLYNEGHGREPWSEELDISRTVGWFTTMSPISIDTGGAPHSLIETLRHVKDARRRLSSRGWSYFTSRFCNSEGIKAFSGHDQMEILFNYLGIYQQLEGQDALFEQTLLPESAAPNAALHTPRSALIDLSLSVREGALECVFGYSALMQHQKKTQDWIRRCEEVLHEAVRTLPHGQLLPTFTDYPLLQLDYNGLDKLWGNVIKKYTLSNAEIENILPCSPIQEGILISKARNSTLYNVEASWKLTSNAAPLNLDRLKLSCKLLVQRHEALRTLFIEADTEQATFYQVILRDAPASLVHVKYNTIIDFEAAGIIYPSACSVPFQLIICETIEDGTYFKIRIDHALIDGTSVRVLIRDLIAIYGGSSCGNIPRYSNFIAYLQAQSSQKNLSFWRSLLDGINPCHFPTLRNTDAVFKEGQDRGDFHAIGIELPSNFSNQIQQFCMTHNTTIATLMSAVWALILSRYLGIQDENVCFGYLASGRDITIPDIHDIVGPMITMLVRKCLIKRSMTILAMIESMQEDFANSLPYQHCSLGRIHRELGLSGQPLFNTTVNVQRGDTLSKQSKSTLNFEAHSGFDPSEVSIHLLITKYIMLIRS